MKRRAFIKNSSLYAVAVSAYGFIHFDGDHFIGDCETTSDIIGPFYRPDGPVRNNFVRKGEAGNPVELSGLVMHKDCKTPYKKAKIELWHCDTKGVYDNTTDEYRYRGTTYSDEKGHYSFNTILPIAYGTGGGNIRPAHFHLMITAEGYQPLVTQLYFSGDPNIAKDVCASSPMAKRRILGTETLKDGTKKVSYNVGMSDKLAADPSAIDKVTGVYLDEKDKTKKTEFFKNNNLLWVKNDVFGENLEYTGNNTFQYPAMPGDMSETYLFEIMAGGSVKLTDTLIDENSVRHTSVYIKA